MSTEMVKLTTTSTGTHRLQIVLPSPSSLKLASSSNFDVANLDTTGPEKLESNHDSAKIHPQDQTITPRMGTVPQTITPRMGTVSQTYSSWTVSDTSLSTKSTSQTSSSISSNAESHDSILRSSQPTFDSINLQTVNVASTTFTSSSTFTSLSLTTALSTQNIRHSLRLYRRLAHTD
ncbi:hypothetical protein BT96DRAFT_993339 [Gymnopus androsaceus JB14]|uniref:Uncharacterized protein n=1 Tax=Gymnopus androsaceus JB14 TaxID=1447944 RepID=A0A6A4HTY7_9AGAR|nr:hypothetical protein BT96DRAFT_993339 [Gymnopus androsaceus JB14]